MQAEFFKNLTPIQQKGRRVPITLQEKVDKEIDKLLEQGYNRWGGGDSLVDTIGGGKRLLSRSVNKIESMNARKQKKN